MKYIKVFNTQEEYEAWLKATPYSGTGRTVVKAAGKINYENITFKDKEATRVIDNTWFNGNGQKSFSWRSIAKITGPGGAFAQNNVIEDFDDFNKFVGVTTLYNVSVTGAFHNCWRLRTITIPKGVTVIPAYCFNSCSSLLDINLPEGLVNIESFAFASDNGLKKIVIPSTVINIGKSTFRTYNNFVRRDIIMGPTIPPTLGATAFHDLNAGVHRLNPNLLIWVPYSQSHSVLNDYKSATNWITYASYIMELDANGNIPE